MAITRAQAEKILVSRVGGFLSRCALSVLSTGANPDLADPIASALRALGKTLSDQANPADGDLSQVADDGIDLFLGVATLYAWRACYGAWAKNDQRISLGEQKFKQVADEIMAAHDVLRQDLLDRYGFGRRRRRQPRLAPIQTSNSWPPLPPPPSTSAPWPAGYSQPPGPAPSAALTPWGFNP